MVTDRVALARESTAARCQLSREVRASSRKVRAMWDWCGGMQSEDGTASIPNSLLISASSGSSSSRCRSASSRSEQGHVMGMGTDSGCYGRWKPKPDSSHVPFLEEHRAEAMHKEPHHAHGATRHTQSLNGACGQPICSPCFSPRTLLYHIASAAAAETWHPLWRLHPMDPTRRLQRRLAQALPGASMDRSLAVLRLCHGRKPTGVDDEALPPTSTEEHFSVKPSEASLSTWLCSGSRGSVPAGRTPPTTAASSSWPGMRTPALTSTGFGVSNEDLVCVEEVEERRNDAVTVLRHLVDTGRSELHQRHGVGPQFQTLLHGWGQA